jgi:hypothetical protein
LFCPSCGVSTSPVEMLELGHDEPLDAREVTFGPAGRSRRSRPGLMVGGLVAAAVFVATVAVGRSGTNSASPSTTAAVDVATSSTTVVESTTTTEPEATTTTSLPERAVVGSGPVLGERTELELWYQASFGGSSSSPSGIYRIDLDSAARDRLTSTMYLNGQFVLAVADATGLSMFASGDSVFHVDRRGNVVHGSQLNGDVIGSDRDGYWLARGTESSPTGLPTTLEHHRLDGSLIGSVAVPANAFIQSSVGDGKFILRGADFRSFLFDANANDIRLLPGSVSSAAGGSLLTIRCSEKLDCPTVFIEGDGVESRVAEGNEGTGYFGPFGPFGRSQQISPDGRWLIRPVFSNNYNGNDPIPIVALNPRTGERVALGNVAFNSAANGPSSATWSPDGRWAFVTTKDGLVAWRPGLTAPIRIPIGEGDATVTAVAVGSSASVATA